MGAEVILVTGSNLGDRDANLGLAKKLIGDSCGEIVKVSEPYGSKPWGDVEDGDGAPAGDFLNQALILETEMEPDRLLEVLKTVEREMGRQACGCETGIIRNRKYLSRIIDIDIIFYGNRVIDAPHLKIPHPLAAEREFVLRPVAEVAGDKKDPVTGFTVRELLDRLRKGK